MIFTNKNAWSDVIGTCA